MLARKIIYSIRIALINILVKWCAWRIRYHRKEGDWDAANKFSKCRLLLVTRLECLTEAHERMGV